MPGNPRSAAYVNSYSSRHTQVVSLCLVFFCTGNAIRRCVGVTGTARGPPASASARQATPARCVGSAAQGSSGSTIDVCSCQAPSLCARTASGMVRRKAWIVGARAAHHVPPTMLHRRGTAAAEYVRMTGQPCARVEYAKADHACAWIVDSRWIAVGRGWVAHVSPTLTRSLCLRWCPSGHVPGTDDKRLHCGRGPSGPCRFTTAQLVADARSRCRSCCQPTWLGPEGRQHWISASQRWQGTASSLCGTQQQWSLDC